LKYGGLLALTYFEDHPSKLPWSGAPQMQAWVLTLLAGLMILFFTPLENFLAWIVTVPSVIILYNLAYYKWIPWALVKKRPLWHYGWRVVLFISPVAFFLALLIIGPTNNEPYSIAAGLLYWFGMLLMTAPGIWLWYHYQQKRNANLQVLEQKLGQSTAQLDQLRAQINPHFLFNALNTVYGLALTEKAGQTADALEKISEMMRFMLRENLEASIPLEKELDYLKNYISIQQMRLGPASQIDLVVDMPDQVDDHLHIAPMLLIPFVENAFKHGISLQAPSFIHLMVRVEDRQLYFSLHNSTHERLWMNDPEKHNHGIGLSNVQQRLGLLYPQRHLLDLRPDDKSYKVSLTLLL
ncbi:MAG TPA: histidine kinase, partial [Phnomibacter sp.]|nr:histidine kinase [Phnomibacter sp.]